MAERGASVGAPANDTASATAASPSETRASDPYAGLGGVEAYAAALRTMPMHIADNAGYDSADLISSLRAKPAPSPLLWPLPALFQAMKATHSD